MHSGLCLTNSLEDSVSKITFHLKCVLPTSEFKKTKICEDGDNLKIKHAGENSN